MDIKIIEKIYNKIMELDYLSVDEYIRSEASKNGVTRAYLISKIRYYVNTLSKEEIEQYTLKIKQSEYSKYQIYKSFLKVKMQIDKNIPIDYSLIYKSKNSNRIISIISSYYKIFPEDRDYVKIMLEQNGCSLDFLNDRPIKYDLEESSFIMSVYGNRVKSILNAKTKEEALHIIKKQGYTVERLARDIELFKSKWSNVIKPDEEKVKNDIDLLEKIYNFYRLSVISTEEKNNKLKVDNKSKVRQVLSIILQNNYSIEEFCHKNIGYNIAGLRREISLLVPKYLDEKQFIQMCNKNNKKLYDELLYIVEYILDDSNDLEDKMIYFYKSTHLSPQDFKKIVLEKFDLSPIQVAYISKICSILRKEKNDLNMNSVLNKRQEIEGKTIVNGVEITKEEKEEIIKYMEEYGFPNSYFIYNILLKKTLKGKIKIKEMRKNI